MKKTIFFLIAFFATCSIFGQAANQVFTTDTTKGAETIYFTGTKNSSNYQGIAGFCFTGTDSCTVILQGCYDTDQWNEIDTISVVSTDGYNIYQAPPAWKYYRIKCTGSALDTCIFTNIRYYLKY